MDSLSEQIELLIRKNYGVGFTSWLKGAALKDFIRIYNNVGGESNSIETCNARNLVLALRAYENFSDGLFVSDYVVFAQHIIQNQN